MSIRIASNMGNNQAQLKNDKQSVSFGSTFVTPELMSRLEKVGKKVPGERLLSDFMNPKMIGSLSEDQYDKINLISNPFNGTTIFSEEETKTLNDKIDAIYKGVKRLMKKEGRVQNDYTGDLLDKCRSKSDLFETTKSYVQNAKPLPESEVEKLEKAASDFTATNPDLKF